MDYGRNDWEMQFTDDVIYHRQLMAEDFTERNAADLFLAARREDGELVGLRVENRGNAVNLTSQQIKGLLNTLAVTAPDQFLNVTRDVNGECPETGIPRDECMRCLAEENEAWPSPDYDD